MKLIEQFEQFAMKNQIGHAYLLFNVDYDSISEDLNNIILKHFFSYDKIKLDAGLSLVEPINLNITKEQIKELQKSFNTFSQVSENKVYIINECEKMNSSAANSLLKFLEEPENNIYAFLISSDVNKVLPTITSRCIKIFLRNKENELSEEDLKISNTILECLMNKDNSDNINKIYLILKSLNREELKKVIDNLIILLRELLNIKFGKSCIYFNDDKKYSLVQKLTDKIIIQKIMFLNDIRIRLDYNINVQMFVDKLVINW